MTQNNSADELSLGVAITMALNIVIPFLLFVLGAVLGFLPLLLAPFVVGVTQLLHVIPLLIWSSVKQRQEFMKGVIITAVITALLNGGCWLILS